MESCTENRDCRNCKSGESIVYAYDDSDKFYDAKLLKYSAHCMCLGTILPVREGKYIYIMTHSRPLDDLAQEVYEGCRARVTWCKKLNNNTHPFFYTGVKI